MIKRKTNIFRKKIEKQKYDFENQNFAIFGSVNHFGRRYVKKKLRCFFFICGQSWMPSLKVKSWTVSSTYLSTYLVIKGPTNQLKKIVKSQGSNGNSPLTLKSANNALMKLYSECYTSRSSCQIPRLCFQVGTSE